MNAFFEYNDVSGESLKKKIDLSNRVNAALVIVFITVFFIDIGVILFSDAEFNTDFLRSVGAIVLCMSNLILNRYGFFKTGRFLLLYLLPLLYFL